MLVLTHQPPSSSSSQWSTKKNSYTQELRCQSKITWGTSLTSLLLPWLSNPLPVPASVGQCLLQLKSTQEVILLTALIFFHWRSSSALSLVSLKRLVFRPSDILMPYWNAALRKIKDSWGKEGTRGCIAVPRCSQMALWLNNLFRNVSARLHPLTWWRLAHPIIPLLTPWPYLVPTHLGKASLLFIYSLYSSWVSKSQRPKGPFLLPCWRTEWAQGRKKCQWKQSFSPY